MTRGGQLSKQHTSIHGRRTVHDPPAQPFIISGIRNYDAGYPESQATFTWWIGDIYAGNFGRERAERLNPFRSYLDRGIRWAGGSGYFVTPLPARYGLWASVDREALLGTSGSQSFGTRESVDIRTALKSYTVWAARQLYLENEAGSLQTGKSADVAVWDSDPFSVPTADVKEMHCELTLFRGNVLYYATGSSVQWAISCLRTSRFPELGPT